MPHVTTPDGVQVHYTDTGGPGPCVIFAHGFFMDGEMFAPQAALAPDYRVITVDARGHGETIDQGAPFDYWTLGSDSWAVLDQLGIDRTALGGLSQGGFTALRMALQQPSRVRGLVLIGTDATAYTEREKVSYRHMMNAWMEPDVKQAARQMAAVMIGGDREAHQMPWVAKWIESDRTRLSQAVEALIGREDISAKVGAIAAPALLLRGAGDLAFSHAQMAALGEQLGGPVVLHEIVADNVTHICNLTHAELVNPIIREFLDSLPA